MLRELKGIMWAGGKAPETSSEKLLEEVAKLVVTVVEVAYEHEEIEAISDQMDKIEKMVYEYMGE